MLYANGMKIIQMNAGLYEEAELTYKELSSRIDMDIIFNEQEMRNLKTSSRENLKKAVTFTHLMWRTVQKFLLQNTVAIAKKHIRQVFFTM